MTPPAASATKLGKHSVVIAGHATSISLEHAFWIRLCALAERRNQSVAAMVAAIDAMRGDANLCSAIRVYLLEAAEEQHRDERGGGTAHVSADAASAGMSQ